MHVQNCIPQAMTTDSRARHMIFKFSSFWIYSENNICSTSPSTHLSNLYIAFLWAFYQTRMLSSSLLHVPKPYVVRTQAIHTTTHRHNNLLLCTGEQRNTFHHFSRIYYSIWNISFIYHNGFFAGHMAFLSFYVGTQLHRHIFYLNSRNCRDVVQIRN